MANGLLGNAKQRIQQRMQQIDAAVGAAQGDAQAAVAQAGREAGSAIPARQSATRAERILEARRAAQTTDSNN